MFGGCQLKAQTLVFRPAFLFMGEGLGSMMKGRRVQGPLFKLFRLGLRVCCGVSAVCLLQGFRAQVERSVRGFPGL